MGCSTGGTCTAVRASGRFAAGVTPEIPVGDGGALGRRPGVAVIGEITPAIAAIARRGGGGNTQAMEAFLANSIREDQTGSATMQEYYSCFACFVFLEPRGRVAYICTAAPQPCALMRARARSQPTRPRRMHRCALAHAQCTCARLYRIANHSNTNTPPRRRHTCQCRRVAP